MLSTSGQGPRDGSLNGDGLPITDYNHTKDVQNGQELYYLPHVEVQCDTQTTNGEILMDVRQPTCGVSFITQTTRSNATS